MTRILGAAIGAALMSMGVAAAADEAGRGPEVMRHVLDAKRSGGTGDDPRVYGGTPVPEGGRPFQVGIASRGVIDDSPESKYMAQFCGGTLIAPRFVLTAAHCFVYEGITSDAGELSVLHGDTTLSRTEAVDVARVIVHPDYDEVTTEADIALLELAEPIAGTTVALADADSEAGLIAPDTVASVTGWGETRADSPDILMEARLRVQDQTVCEAGLIDMHRGVLAEEVRRAAKTLGSDASAVMAALERFGEGGDPIPDTMLCAGTMTGARDSCRGDSGGPLFADTENGPVQIGIVSWGAIPPDAEGPCGHPELFGYYTRITSFADWIDANVE